jgi:hypothetical protein
MGFSAGAPDDRNRFLCPIHPYVGADDGPATPGDFHGEASSYPAASAGYHRGGRT